MLLNMVNKHFNGSECMYITFALEYIINNMKLRLFNQRVVQKQEQ